MVPIKQMFNPAQAQPIHSISPDTDDFGVIDTSDNNTYTYYTQNSHISEMSREYLSSSEEGKH